VAVDISVDFLRQSLASLQREHPHMDDGRRGAGLFGRPGAAGGLVRAARWCSTPAPASATSRPTEALRLLREARGLLAPAARC
jgi:hypothetical protein